MSTEESKKLGFVGLMKSFPKQFWVASVFELLERFAWYGMFAILSLYLVASKDIKGLGFTDAQGGQIIGDITALLYFLPLITGAIADRIGYKTSLSISFIMLAIGYASLGYVHSYWAFYFVFLFLGLGAAMFKPVASAIVTCNTSEKNSSMGFGVFYMMVNIGGWIGPLIVGKLRGESNWIIAFHMAAAVILINLLFNFFVFKQDKVEKTSETISETIKKSFANIWEALKDSKLTVLLIIMIGFWTLFNQLFYTLPKYIQDWVDLKALYNDIYSFSPAITSLISDGNEAIAKPELLVNLDAFAIIIFQMVISYIIIKWKPVNAMIIGFIIVSLGIGLTFYFRDGLFVIAGVLIFAIGEMTANPKFSAYIAEISPKGKEALYMGTYFLPVFVGNKIAGWLSGSVYGEMSSKITLAQKEAVAKGFEMVDKNGQLVTYTKTGFKAIDKAGNVIKDAVVNITKNDYITQVASKLKMDANQFTEYLWNTHHPNEILYIFVGIGLFTFFALVIYDKVFVRRMDKKAALEN